MDKSVQIIMQILSERGIKPGTMMRELGFSSGLFSQWKAGTQKPSADKIQKIADFLGVSSDYLLGRETPRAATDEELMFALFDGTEGVTDAMYEEVKQFARFVKQREAHKNDL